MANRKTNYTAAAETALSTSLAAGATTINVESTADLPAVPFYVTIDPGDDASRETVLVDSGKTATTLTLTSATSRGQAGTSDTDHDATAVVAHVASAASMNDLHDRISDHTHSGGDDGAAVDANDADTLDGLNSLDFTQEVDDYVEVAGSVSLTGTYAVVASIDLDIPAPWNGWKCFATVTYASFGDSSTDDTYSSKFTIDGTDLQEQTEVNAAESADASPRHVGSLVGYRSGMATTGTRSIEFQAIEVSGNVTIRDIAMYVRAVRTS